MRNCGAKKKAGWAAWRARALLAKSSILLAADRWDLLAPMLAVITDPERRLRATAHTARLVTNSPIKMGIALYNVALQALEDFTMQATPLRELAVIETCIDILKRNDVIEGEMVNQAIFMHLDTRLQPPRTSAAAKLAMRPRVRQEMQVLFKKYQASRDEGLPICDGLQKVLHGLSGERVPILPPIRPGTTNVISLSARKPA